MKSLAYLKSLFVLIIVFGLTSCEEYYDIKNSDGKLCGYTWLEEYATVGGDWCTHTLVFDRSGSGREVYKYDNGSQVTTISSRFSWYWTSNMECIELDFGAGDLVFFDNVWVRDYYLSGNYDGEEVTFRRQ
ncbi:hypothetical protein D0T50_07290 [Bacteroides sp. 214]|uniref:hypothetical protein n=1 Tax=Bacteroides sp. 214 TaxID=2302935 RepID=UPI0013D4C9DF|nr:hypothetical protein [Bacteroides sp. 214]NDW12691.1 hypothetical protein [Bacteroides sp. 214]